jgi:hypothetical protein
VLVGAAPAHGWGAPETRSEVGVSCLDAPLGGAGPAAWLQGRATAVADLADATATGRIAGRRDFGCPLVTADGGLVVRRRWKRLLAGDAVLTRGGGIGESVSVAGTAGEAVVAWNETRQGRTRVMASARPFTERVELESEPVLWIGGPLVRMDAEGNAVALWRVRIARGRVLVRVARRLAGGVFGAPETVAATRDAGDIALTVAPDGRVLVAWDDRRAVRAALAEPGGAFGEPVAVGTPDVYAAPRAAAGPAGHLALAWSTGEEVLLAAAPPGGPIGTAEEVWRDPAAQPPSSILDVAGGLTRYTADPHVALDADGRVALAWTDANDRLTAATIAPGATPDVATELGSPCRKAALPFAGFGPDGRAAVAYLSHGGEHADNRSSAGLGVVHVIREGERVAAPQAPPLRVRLRVRRMVVRTRVTAPGSDVRAAIFKRGRLAHEVFTHGSRRITLDPDWSASIDRPEPGDRVTVRVTACRRGGGVARAERRVTLRR